MLNKIKNRLSNTKSKKGFNTLTTVVGVFIAIMVIGGLADLTILQTKFNALSTQTGYVSRVVGSQGGISTARIDNYRGRYVTSQELYGNISDVMTFAGISEDDWTVKINNYTLTPATHVPTQDYGERVSVEVSINYGWAFTSKFLPGNMNNSRTSKSEIVTTYRIRDGGYSE